MGKDGVIYAIKVESLSSSGLKMMDVKIGKTTNLKSTLSQYERSHREVETLDLWKPNKDVGLSQCETGVHAIAEHHAYERKRELFVFLQDGYEDFSEEISRLLDRTTREEIEKEEEEVDEVENKREIDLVREGEEISVTGSYPKLVKFKGENFEVDYWKDVLRVITKKIYDEVKDFSKAEEIKGSSRIYFSTNKDEVMNPIDISNSPYYVIGHASSQQIVNILTQLLKKFDYEKGDVKIVLVD